MNVAKYLFKENGLEKSNVPLGIKPEKCQLVLGFGDKALLADPGLYARLRADFPNADIALGSTAGEIYRDEALDAALVITAIEFEKTPVKSAEVDISNFASSYAAGAALVKKLDPADLKYVFILSDGGLVNGSELERGAESVIDHQVPVTGCLAGDGTQFKSTLVGLNASAKQGHIVAIGLYGSSIQISHGSMGGWEMFGLEKTITRSTANELFEIDHVNALELYKQYLGKYVEELPGSALLFPLSIKLPGASESIVRTILSINYEHNSMIFAGDVPEGSRVRFMKANFDKLIEAASEAAQHSALPFKNRNPKLALLISCVGRKIILGKRVDEEVEAVHDIFPEGTQLTGFYSYGEISPLNPGTKCELHNQTMTITTFDET